MRLEVAGQDVALAEQRYIDLGKQLQALQKEKEAIAGASQEYLMQVRVTIAALLVVVVVLVVVGIYVISGGGRNGSARRRRRWRWRRSMATNLPFFGSNPMDDHFTLHGVVCDIIDDTSFLIWCGVVVVLGGNRCVSRMHGKVRSS